MSEKYDEEKLENIKKQIELYGTINIRKAILDSVILTNTILLFEDIKVLQESDAYSLIEQQLLSSSTPEFYPKTSDEELEIAKKDYINGANFSVVSSGDDYKFEGNIIDEKVEIDINLDKLNDLVLIYTVRNAMKRKIKLYGDNISKGEMDSLENNIGILDLLYETFKKSSYSDNHELNVDVDKVVNINKSLKESAIMVEKPEDLTDLDSVVVYLKKLNDSGSNVYLDFNGHNLYSCNIDFDGAYLEVFGMKRDEHCSMIGEFILANSDDEKIKVIDKYNAIKENNIKNKMNVEHISKK